MEGPRRDVAAVRRRASRTATTARRRSRSSPGRSRCSRPAKKLARALSDKGLRTDADTNRADAITAGAAMAGVLGIGLGRWWADAVAAAVISIDIAWDGLKAARGAVHDRLDGASETLEGERDTICARVANELRPLAWVARVGVRVRRAGHVLVGEAFVVRRRAPALDELKDAGARIRRREDRLNVVVVPVDELPVANAT